MAQKRAIRMHACLMTVDHMEILPWRMDEGKQLQGVYALAPSPLHAPRPALSPHACTRARAHVVALRRVTCVAPHRRAEYLALERSVPKDTMGRINYHHVAHLVHHLTEPKDA